MSVAKINLPYILWTGMKLASPSGRLHQTSAGAQNSFLKYGNETNELKQVYMSFNVHFSNKCPE